jgi:hypothetical protein
VLLSCLLGTACVMCTLSDPNRMSFRTDSSLDHATDVIRDSLLIVLVICIPVIGARTVLMLFWRWVLW